MSGFIGLDEAITRWSRRADALPRVVREEATDICTDALPAIQQRTPVDSGQTRDGWTVEPGTTSAPAALANPLRHAGFVQDGELPSIAAEEFQRASKARPSFSTRLQREVP